MSAKSRLTEKYNETLYKIENKESSFFLSFYKFLILAQIAGQTVFAVFPSSFLLGGTHQEPYSRSVGETIWDYASILVHFGFWMYVRYNNVNFLRGKYLSGDVQNLRTDQKNIHVTQRVEQRKSALSTALVSLFLGTIYNSVASWTYLNRNSQFVPNSVGDNVLNAPKPGAFVANTAHVGNVEFVRFDFAQVIPIFVRTVIILFFLMLYLRLASDSPVLVGNGEINEEGTHIRKYGVMAMSAYVLYGILMGMGLTFTVNDSGTHEGVSIIGLGVVYAVALVAFIAYIGGFWWEKDYFNEDLYWRIVLSILSTLALLAFYGIYFAYVWGTVSHSGADWNDGWSPKFDFTAPPAGQSNYFLYTLDIGIIATVSIIMCSVILVLIMFESRSIIKSLELVSEIPRPSVMVTYISKWVFNIYWLIISAFLLNAIYGHTNYLAERWEDFTIGTSIATFVVCGPFAVITFLSYKGESARLERSLNYSTISMTTVAVVLLGLWIWIVAFMARHFNSLGHVAAAANLKDETKPMYVYFYALVTKLLLLIYFVVMYSIQYIAESVISLIVNSSDVDVAHMS